jgi:hypothetical protein
MIKPEQVPEEAMEALIATMYGKPGLPYREALAAALAAWPNKESLNKPGDWGRYIVLPLTQEARDDR